MSFTVKITGLREVQRKLNALPDKVQKKVVRAALRRATVILQKAVKADAPVGDTGQLRKAVKITTSFRKGVISAKVTIGKKNFVGDTYYAAIVEFGSKYQEGQHFMERAFDANKQNVAEQAAVEIKDGILKEASK